MEANTKNQKMFRQTFQKLTPIGEVFMSLFENTHFSSHHPLLAHITYWHRYVDDVLCLWEGNLPLAGEFLNHLNSFFPSINFTLEVST